MAYHKGNIAWSKLNADKMPRGEMNPSWKGGKPKCLDCGKECSYASKGRCQVCANKFYHSKERNVNWRGGVTPEHERERKSAAYRRWHRAVLKRDNHQCVWCGSTEDLEVDHIKPFAFYPELRTEITNGRTLCLECHQKTFVFWGNQNTREVMAL